MFAKAAERRCPCNPEGITQSAGADAPRDGVDREVIANWLRLELASVIVHGVHYTWRGVEILTRRRLPLTYHYIVMGFFRTLFESYPVTISYPNPITTSYTLRLSLDLCENSHQWYFRLRGRYEFEHMLFLGRALQDVETFIDVGANVGVFAVTIAQAFPNRKVIAVEPLAANYSRLCHNIRLNGLGNVRAVHGAVTPEVGEVAFYANPIHDGGGSVVPPDAYRTGDVAISVDEYVRAHPDFKERIQVLSVPLDTLVGGPAVVKVDVEGGEVGVLASGQEAMRSRLLRAIVVEVRETTAGSVVELLRGQGYACLMLDRKGRRHPVDLALGRRPTNLLAVAPDFPLRD